jgi:hypothetical protein
VGAEEDAPEPGAVQPLRTLPKADAQERLRAPDVQVVAEDHLSRLRMPPKLKHGQRIP